MTSKISILSPSFNYGRYIEQALLSVAGQEDGFYEHIVVDDASTDIETLQVLQGWQDRVTLSFHERNMGLSATLNDALSLATGEWVGWLNTDDFYLPGAFAAVRRTIVDHPKADVIFGDTIFVDSESRLLRLAPEHRFSKTVLRCFGTYMAPPALFIRKSTIPRRGWDTRTIKLMDWDLYLQLHADGAKFHHIGRPLGAFRRHPAQTSASRTPIEEKQMVRERFGLPTDSRLIELRGQFGRVYHGLLKMANGAYRRQYEARKSKGLDLRWFHNSEALDACEELLNRCSANNSF